MSSIYSTLTSRSGLPTTILIVSIPLCALEYKRWDLGGSLCIWFGLLALVALMLPQELTRILDMIQKSRGPEITADDGPFKVVVFMRLRLKDTAATVDGLRALLALTDTELSEAPSNRSKLARLGAASLLLDVLAHHADNDSVCVRALTSLKHLSLQKDVQEHFAKAGSAAVTPVFRVLTGALRRDQERHEQRAATTTAPASGAATQTPSAPKDDEAPAKVDVDGKRAAELHRLSFLVLGAVCENVPDLQTALVDEGLLERFAAAQQWFPHHAPLALWGLWACFQTCTSGNPHNKVTFVRSRALPACLDAMAQHSDDAALQRQGLGLLFAVLMKPGQQSDHGISQSFDVEPLREAAKSSGLLSAVQNAIQNHKDEPTIQAIGKQIRAAS